MPLQVHPLYVVPQCSCYLDCFQGLNIQGVQIVIQYEICKTMPELIQCAGRAVCDPTMNGLLLLMFKSWALKSSSQQLTTLAQILTAQLQVWSRKHHRSRIKPVALAFSLCNVAPVCVLFLPVTWKITAHQVWQFSRCVVVLMVLLALQHSTP